MSKSSFNKVLKPTPSTGTVANGSNNAVANAIVNNQQTNPLPTNHPTDSYIPSHLINLIPELNSYQQLVEAEKKLDIYLARKKIDLYQSVSQWNNSRQAHRDFSHYDKDHIKYLRLFVSNIAENQPWQDATQNISNGSWTMRIEGRLLDAQSAEDTTRPKFSSFIQDIAVDFKKKEPVRDNENSDDVDVDMTNEADVNKSSSETANGLTLPLKITAETSNSNTTQPSDVKTIQDKEKSNIYDAVEWHYDAKNPVDFDGLDIKRPGSENVDCTVTIQLRGFTGNNLEYSSELALLIGKSHGSLHEAIYSIYKYILLNDLLISDKSDLKSNSGNNTNGEKNTVKLDDFLIRLLPENSKQAKEQEEGEVKTLKLSELPPLVNSHISPIRPIKTDYTIRVDKASTYGELVFDVEVPEISQLQNPSAVQSDELTSEGLKLLSELDKISNETRPKLDELDKQTNNLQLQLAASSNKYVFFNKLANDPVPALQEYMASSANALKVLSGDEGFNEDTVRRAQFYKENEGVLFENLGVLLANGRL